MYSVKARVEQNDNNTIMIQRGFPTLQQAQKWCMDNLPYKKTRFYNQKFYPHDYIYFIEKEEEKKEKPVPVTINIFVVTL